MQERERLHAAAEERRELILQVRSCQAAPCSAAVPAQCYMSISTLLLWQALQYCLHIPIAILLAITQKIEGTCAAS